MKNKKLFLYLFLFLFSITSVFAYSCEQYIRPAVDSFSAFIMDCAGTGYSSIQDEIGTFDTSVAGDEGKYNGRGGTGQGFVTNIFDNDPNNQEYVFLDMSGDATNLYHVTVLQFINGSTVKSYEQEVTADGTVTCSHNMQPELFDLNNDGRQELIFICKDGTTSTLFMYGLNASNGWQGGEIADLGYADAWKFSKIMCMNANRPGYTLNGRFCMVAGDGQDYLTGYKYDGSKAFSVDTNFNDFFMTYSPQILITDLNNDGIMELIGESEDYLRVISESGSAIYTSPEQCYYGVSTYKAGRINNVKYLAYECPNGNDGNTKIRLLYNDYTSAWNYTIASTTDNNNNIFFGVPKFFQGEDVICYPYALASDSKLSYKCYDTVGNLDSTIVSSITVNNNYYTNEYSQHMFDYEIPQNADETVVINAYNIYQLSDTGSIASITDLSNLYETGSYAETLSYKPPAIGDMDCDDKLDLVMTVCDSDQSPCATRMLLSGNATVSCSQSGVIVGNNTVQCYQCINNYLYTTYFTNVCEAGWYTTAPSCDFDENVTLLTTCYKCIEGIKYESVFDGGCETGWSTNSAINCTLSDAINGTLSSVNYLPQIVYNTTNYVNPWRNGSMIVFYLQVLDQEDDSVYERIDCGTPVEAYFNEPNKTASMYLSRSGEVIRYADFISEWFNPYQYPNQWRGMSWNNQLVNDRECKTTSYGRTCETFFGCVYDEVGNYTVSVRFADDEHQFLGTAGINWYVEKTWNLVITSNGNVNVVEVLLDNTDVDVGSNELNTNDNSIKDAFDSILGNTGLGYTALWFIFMIIIAVAIWIYGSGNPISTGVIVFTEMLMIILGTYLGFIGIGIIIALVLVSLAVVVVYMRNLFLGTNG